MENLINYTIKATKKELPWLQYQDHKLTNQILNIKFYSTINSEELYVIIDKYKFKMIYQDTEGNILYSSTAARVPYKENLKNELKYMHNKL